ncbi:anillin-like [Vespa mandarinia]|uniref:anillin-like n=1 Tax=Vespa mandarinia TaxID=7446 RepID=UPI00160A4A72|nr:anillin-like [Vespa mandarinia]XP_035740594.1 anillin-like [Vespa mandarinia]
MVLSNTMDNAEESFMRRFICRASVKKQESFELPAIQPRRKMNILYAISIYRFKGFRHKCTRLSTTALDCLNKEILIKSENSAKDIPIPSKFLENEIFLDECKRDIITKKCQNWDIKIETTLYDDDLPLYDIFIPRLTGIKKEALSSDLVKEKSEITCKDNKKDKRCLKTEKNLNEPSEIDETSKKETPYTRLNEAIKDLKEHMELSECKINLMNSSKVPLDLRINSNVQKEGPTDYVPGKYKVFEDTLKKTASKNSESIEEKFEGDYPIDLPQCQYATPVSRNNELNKNKKKIEKPKRMRPNLESTRKSSPIDLTKKNISPSSVQSTISTITPIVSSKFETEEKNDNKYSYESLELTENVVPSVQKFLNNALGNERSSTSYIPNTTTNSYEGNLCENRIEEPVTPPTGQIHNPRLLASEPLPQGNINRKSKLFRSFSQRIKRISRTFVNTEEKGSDEFIITLNQNDKIQELLQKLEIQQTLIHQASKALNLCIVMKTFQHSTQHVESERLLLLSTLKKQAVLSEIKRINGPMNDNVVKLYEQGEVNISSIGLRLKEDALILISQTPDMSEWFIITVTHESMVWATIAMNYSIDSPTKISFPDTITIPNLGPNFKILITLYSLQLRNTCYNKKEGHSCNNNISCPSPTNLWRRNERSRVKQNEIQCSSIRDTSFEPSGYAELTLQDIHEVSPWSLLSVPSNSILQGLIDLEFSCKIRISVVHAGFLTHGNEAGGFAAWNRRWCVLDGSLLKFWNYPQEHDLRPPLLIIDLTHCTSNEVQVVDRSLCAKPRTLMFKTIRERIPHDKSSMFLECNTSYTIIKNLLSCDTITDLMEWRSKLNYVLSLLRNWNSRRNDLIPTTEL